MKKLVVSFILAIFMFSAFYPTIYATENMLENEIEEKLTEENKQKEKKESENSEKDNIQEEISNDIIFPEENVEEAQENLEEKKLVENTISNSNQESEIISDRDPFNIQETTPTEEVKTVIEDYTGAIYIDTPNNQATYEMPDVRQITLSGWAVSNDENSVLKLYVNGACWGEIGRNIERPDVNAVFPQYASTTAKAGYSYNVDISAFPEGAHNIRVEEVSRYGKVIATASVGINVKQRQYNGYIYIDTPTNNSIYKSPDISQVALSGWAVSNDENSVLKLYVNGACWGEIGRTIERPDVNTVFPQYASTTAKAGYSYNVDISAFPEGNHTIRVEEVSRYGKVIATASVGINVKQRQYNGYIYVDTPTNNSIYKSPDITQVALSGWAVSNDENSVLKLYVNGACWGEIERNIVRSDVNAVFPQYASTTAKAGYSYNVDISAFPEGTHNIRVEEVSRCGKVIATASTNIYVSTPDYPGLMYIDTPIQNKRYRSGGLTVSGWAVTTSPNDYVLVYLDGVYQAGAESRVRNDVIDVYGSQFGLTANSRPGFYSEISTAHLAEGIHTVKVVHYSKYHKKIQEAEVRFMISNTLTWGIDVSHHNGAINWDAVRNSGVNFAILKIGEYRESTGRTLKDDHFEEYYAACKARGIAVGGYIYSYAFDSNEAAHEAEACLSMIQGKSFEMPIFFDLEDHLVTDAIHNGRTNVQNVTNGVITFCDIMNARGYQAGVYSYRNFFYQYLNMPALEKYNVWLAHYVTETDYTGKYDMWQYTSSGSLPGINGNVDLNWCFKRF